MSLYPTYCPCLFPSNFQQGITGHRGWPGRNSFITHGGAVRKSNFPLHDAAGPVLTGTVTLYEREGPGDDTLVISVSEAVTSLIGSVLVLTKGSGQYPIAVKAIIGSDQATNTFTVLANAGEIPIAREIRFP